MAGKEHEHRVFVGGLSGDVTSRQLEDAFSRFGKILDAQVLVERETGRPRGFGFLTYADRRAMDDAIREMHGIEFGERVISVNRAKPRVGGSGGGGEDLGHGFGGGGGGGYSSGGRGSSSSYYGGGGDRSLGQDECFKCGRPGHWARDCPSAGGGGQFSSRLPRFVGTGGRYGDRERFMDDRYDGGGRYDRYYDNTRDIKYGPRDRYVSERSYKYDDGRYQAPGGDRFGERYSDRYPVNGYGKERDYYDRGERHISSSDRYGVGGPARGYQGKSYRDRTAAAAPYDRPRRGGGGRLSSFDRY